MTVPFAPEDQEARDIATGTSSSPVSVPNVPTAASASFQVGATGTIPFGWILPVVGMGKDNWSKGSFGYQKPASKGGHVHSGTDIYMPRGSSIVASVSGTVTSVGSGAVSGNYVKMRGDDGIDYYYAHMDEPATVGRGQQITAGAHLGLVGNSGNASGTSPHLHFTMKRNGKAISPNDFLAAGKEQQFTPMSALAGMNSVEDIQEWVRQEMIRQQNADAQYRTQDMSGLPQAMRANQLDPTLAARNQKMTGQQVLGTTLDQLSRRIAGGDRQMWQETALDPGSSLESGVPTTEEGQVVSVSQMREPTPVVEKREAT